MVAALAQLHDNVEETCLAFLLARGTVDGINVLFKQHTVPLALHVGHADVEVDLLLGEERVLDIGLDTTQEEGAEDLVELLDNGIRFIAVLGLEPFVKVFARGEDVGKDKVEQSPELVEVVLQRCTGDQEASATGKGTDDLGEKRVDILDTVGLVNGNVLPAELFQRRLFTQTHFVRRDEDVKLLGKNLVRNELGTLLLGALEDEHTEAGHPFLDLTRPVVQCRLGDNDEVGAGRAAVELEVAQEGDGLQCLSEALGVS
jgi:hypothetical protein